MPKYLFTSDLRISDLSNRIKDVASYVQSGNRISDINDKSDNNNATTLAFYFNLNRSSEICKAASIDPITAIRNYILKFQFPNTRTQESLNDSINDQIILAPYRAVVRVLHRMAELDRGNYGIISLNEILYFIFCNRSVYGNPNFLPEDIITSIDDARRKNTDLEPLIKRIISWNQYERQVREMMTVLTIGFNCFKLKKGVLSLEITGEDYNQCKKEIEKILTYNYMWFPTNKNDFAKTTKEYSSYMDTKETAYSVIDFKSKNRKERLVVNDDENISYLSFITAIRTKPFILLAGISGTGKSRIVRRLSQATDDIDEFEDDDDRWKLQRPTNFELIQVKPNWHNSMDVVGFQSNIPEPHYEFTPFVDFVVKAWCHQDTPFFLCLDEMNLAPVEEYFAEFLSAIESRAIGEDGEYETDPIIKPFDSFGKDLSGTMMRHFLEMGYDLPKEVETRLRKKGLTLPKNLIVMGTVNMDETTFSFSRKVLDRAMSIEMNEVDYDGFIEGKTEYNVPNMTKQNSLFVDRPISAQEVKEEIESQEVMDFLKEVNEILEGTPFKLGYRAANEAILYVAADMEVGADNVQAALDDFTLMKILSRIEGDDSKLVTKDGEKLLDKLYNLLNSDDVFGKLPNSKSLAKLDNMRNTLNRDHFVSFWG